MKGQWSKLFILTIAFLYLAGACAAPPPPPMPAPPTVTPVAPTPTPDPAAPVKAWVDALNSGNVDAALALFTDDVSYVSREYFADGKDDLRGIFDWLAGLETKYQVTECQPKDGGVVCTMPVVDACIAGFGATNGLPTKQMFTLQQDGRISDVSVDLEGGEWNNYFSRWVHPGVSWVQANRPDESAKIDAAANRREAGAIQAKLCKEYGESLKATPTSAPSSDAEKLARKFADAYNRRDLDTMLALFVDDGLSYFGDSFAARDKDALKEYWEQDFGLGYTLEIVDCAPKGEALRCTAVLREDYCLRAWCGLDMLHYELTLKPEDGKIQLMSFYIESAEEQQACNEGWSKFRDWAEANRPDDWKKVSAPAAYDLTGRAFGELQSGICKAYLEATKQ